MYTRAVQHFAATRSLEVLALQASPILGAVLGGFSLGRHDAFRLSVLLLGSLALTAHVFVFNDWTGHRTDIRARKRATVVFSRRGISSRQVARLAIALLVLSNVAFAFVSNKAVLIGAGITTLSLLYSWSSSFGKSTPIAASLNHLIGGGLHFLLGYTLFHDLDSRGLVLSLFFGLVFAAGHLNQEVRDFDSDLLNGITTGAVLFGRKRAFLASLSLFIVAYAMLVVLAALGILPKLLLCSALAWPLHVTWSLQALQRGLGFETALWMQRRYRLLFALIGIAMLVK